MDELRERGGGEVGHDELFVLWLSVEGVGQLASVLWVWSMTSDLAHDTTQQPLSRVFLGKAEVRFVCDGMVVSIKVILFH
jgi:hypothetical protein